MKKITDENLIAIREMIDETLDIGKTHDEDQDDADWYKMNGVLFSNNEARIIRKLIDDKVKKEACMKCGEVDYLMYEVSTSNYHYKLCRNCCEETEEEIKKIFASMEKSD